MEKMRSFKKVASTGPHYHEGRAVADGEVVELTETQAYALRDRFVPVDGEAAQPPAPLYDGAPPPQTPPPAPKPGAGSTPVAPVPVTGDKAANKAAGVTDHSHGAGHSEVKK